MQNNMSDENLLLDYFEHGNRESRNVLVERYSYISEIISKKFAQYENAEYDDLYQVGVLAIIKAIDRFKLDKNVKLATFLSHSVTGEIKNYFRDKADLLKKSRQSKKIYVQIKKAENYLTNLNGQIPTAEQIATHLNVSKEAVIEAIESSNSVMSLDTVMSDGETSLYEMIPDMTNDYDRIDNRDFFKSCLKQLSEVEQKLISYRYIDGYSQADTAKRLNVSQMLISRLERKILAKLKKIV